MLGDVAVPRVLARLVGPDAVADPCPLEASGTARDHPAGEAMPGAPGPPRRVGPPAHLDAAPQARTPGRDADPEELGPSRPERGPQRRDRQPRAEAAGAVLPPSWGGRGSGEGGLPARLESPSSLLGIPRAGIRSMAQPTVGGTTFAPPSLLPPARGRGVECDADPPTRAPIARGQGRRKAAAGRAPFGVADTTFPAGGAAPRVATSGQRRKDRRPSCLRSGDRRG